MTKKSEFLNKKEAKNFKKQVKFSPKSVTIRYGAHQPDSRPFVGDMIDLNAFSNVLTNGVILAAVTVELVKSKGEKFAEPSEESLVAARSSSLAKLCIEKGLELTDEIHQRMAYAEDVAMIAYRIEEDLIGFKSGFRENHIHEVMLITCYKTQDKKKDDESLYSLARFRAESFYLGLRETNGSVAEARLWENNNQELLAYAKSHIDILLTNRNHA